MIQTCFERETFQSPNNKISIKMKNILVSVKVRIHELKKLFKKILIFILKLLIISEANNERKYRSFSKDYYTGNKHLKKLTLNLRRDIV